MTGLFRLIDVLVISVAVGADVLDVAFVAHVGLLSEEEVGVGLSFQYLRTAVLASDTVVKNSSVRKFFGLAVSGT